MPTPPRSTGTSRTQSTRRRLGAAVAALTLATLVFTGCGGKRGAKSVSGYDPEASIGVYRARIEAADGTSRRFRMRLFVARPDRLHAEMSGAVGGPRLILDAGSGRLALTVVEDRTTYVGGTGREDVRRALGIDTSVAGFIEALLDGAAPEGGVTFSRSGDEPGALPERFEVAIEDGALRMERKRIQPLPDGAADALGAGQVPPGTEIRPLAEIGEGGLLGVTTEDEPS